MSKPLRSRLAVVAAASTLALAPTAASAAHAGQSAPPSTPVPIATPNGTLMSYVVNVKKANAGQTKKAEREVVAAGGKVVQSWPEIGVVVAHSDKANFLAKIRASKTVYSAGPTRTAPVKEGTPGQGGSQATGAAGGRSGPASSAAIDPRENEQWDMRMIRADKAHEITDGSRAVTVAVVDSGIEPDHPDLARQIDTKKSVNCTDAGRIDTSSTGWYATTSGHGTHVAGTIAAARNGVGIVGVAPAVKLASVKVVNDDGFIYPEYAVCGIMWTAQKKIPVANHSYYVDPFQFWCDDQADQAPAKEAVRRAFLWANRKGTISAAAAGNSSYDLAHKTTDSESPNDTTPVERKINATCHDIPTELPGVVTVSAADSEGKLATFSNYGEGVIDVTAPGVKILSTYTGQRWALLSGTSMASPHAAGVLALLKSTHRDAKPEQLLAMLREQATNKPCPTGDTKCTGSVSYNAYFGSGMVDALKAVGGR